MDTNPRVLLGDMFKAGVGRMWRLTSCFFALVAGLLAASQVSAGNPNFVVYEFRTEKQGTKEIYAFSDYSTNAPGDPNYTAQLLELEYALTDRLETSFYLDGGAEAGDGGYRYRGFHFETRYRPFDNVFLNPTFYVEYENLEPDHLYLFEALGRSDTPEPRGPESTEHELETRLILGQSVSDRLALLFNWINEASFDNGRTEFGYATGLDYLLYGSDKETGYGRHRAAGGRNWEVEKMRLGVEVFGGLGDSVLGLTLDPKITAQYAGVNLRTEFENGFSFTVGGTAGLTDVAEQALVRMKVGYELH